MRCALLLTLCSLQIASQDQIRLILTDAEAGNKLIYYNVDDPSVGLLGLVRINISWISVWVFWDVRFKEDYFSRP